MLTDDSTEPVSEGEGSAPRGIQSIEVGFRLLQYLEKASEPLSLKVLAERTGMSPSRARFYLVSFMRLGLIAQTRDHGHYELGPYARHLGLVAIRGMDVVRASAAPLENLRHVVKQGAFLSVWGNRGPTIVSTVDGPQEMPMSVRIGYVMPVLYTATGRVFLSYLPREATHPLVTEELVATLREKGAEATNKMASSINRIVKDCRRAGFSCTEGLLNPRIAGVAAPVFDHRGSLAAVVTVIGLGDQLDVRPESRNVRMLLRATEEISTALGFHADLHNESSIAGTSDEWASLTAADIGEDV